MFPIETLEICDFTLQGISHGGIGTSLYVPEIGVMFDVGLCPWGASEHSNTILISHGHADHIAGLPYLISQRHLRKLPPPQIHLPLEIEAPMRQIIDLWSQVEGYTLQWSCQGHLPGNVMPLANGLRAQALRTTHRIPSLAWMIQRVSQKLKPEFQGKTGSELGALRKAGVSITNEHVRPLFCVTGDTKIEFFDQHEEARRAQVLVHEVTIWDNQSSVEKTRLFGHTHLEEILERADLFTGEALVLVHRSQRYTRADVDRILRLRCPAVLEGRVFIFG